MMGTLGCGDNLWQMLIKIGVERGIFVDRECSRIRGKSIDRMAYANTLEVS